MSGGGGGGGGWDRESGVGGTGGSSGGGSSNSGTTDCGSLVVITILNSPVQKVIGQLRKGDCLDVVMVTAGTITRLEAKRSSGETAGSLTPPELVRIVNCIKAGHKYVAVVTSPPTGGIVNIRIQSASS